MTLVTMGTVDAWPQNDYHPSEDIGHIGFIGYLGTKGHWSPHTQWVQRINGHKLTMAQNDHDKHYKHTK